MPGPRPKPTRLRLLEGNRSKRPINVNEPKPETAVPACPSWLPAEAKREWKRLGAELDRMGLISALDRAGFAAYCVAWSDFRQATEQIGAAAENKIQDTSGGKAASAWVRSRDAAMTQIRQFLAEFGLSPAARTKLSVGPAKPKRSKDVPEPSREPAKPRGA